MDTVAMVGPLRSGRSDRCLPRNRQAPEEEMNHARRSPPRPRRRPRRGARRPDDRRTRPTRSSAWPRPASAARTCGRTAASRSVDGPAPMGHEYVGIVEEVGDDVTHRQAGPVRRRLVLRLRQHLRDLPGRLPVLAASTRELMGTIGTQAEYAARPAGRRHPRRHPRACRPTTWSRACWPPPTCSAPAGSPPSPPRPGRARRSRWSVTAPSGCSACSRRSSSAPSGSSR